MITRQDHQNEAQYHQTAAARAAAEAAKEPHSEMKARLLAFHEAAAALHEYHASMNPKGTDA